MCITPQTITSIVYSADMEIIKNQCYGGYSLSIEAKIEIAKRKGKDIYFFGINKEPLTHEEAKKQMFAMDYTVPNPYELGVNKPDKDGLYTTANKLAKEISIDFEDRTDPDIVAVVKKLGKRANGRCANLKVVEIPDDIEYEIDDYDGLETIREKHRTW